MQTIEVGKNIRLGFDDILNSIQQWDNQTLAKFGNEINRLISNRKDPKMGKRDAELLKKIKNILPSTIKRRQKQLFTKLEDNTLSPKEHEELILLNNFIEEKTAERIALMGELATLRHITIQELALQFNHKTK
jgi:CO dehydrogenase/acetyl-CoA synthase delta subunit